MIGKILILAVIALASLALLSPTGRDVRVAACRVAAALDVAIHPAAVRVCE